MNLITLLVLLVVLGVLWWLVLTYVPIPEPGKKIIHVIFILLFALLAVGVFVTLLNVLGLGDIRIGLPPKA